MNQLPVDFIKRLESIIPAQYLDNVQGSFSFLKALTIRINTLKAAPALLMETLREAGIDYESVPWCKEALILKNISSQELSKTGWAQKGLVYQQNLSSILVSLILGSQEGENILDMCAAPGSKATHMASLMNNKGNIICLEPVKERFYKLKSVIDLMGAKNIECLLKDGRNYKTPFGLFDRILIDSPCSCEGSFQINENKTYAYWSLRKIKEMVQKQKGLLAQAAQLLKPGGVLVYSTCTFAPEENEGIIDWFLKKNKVRYKTLPVKLNGIKTYPSLVCWQGKNFDEQIQNCVRILPDKLMDGFFIAKIERVS